MADRENDLPERNATKFEKHWHTQVLIGFIPFQPVPSGFVLDKFMSNNNG